MVEYTFVLRVYHSRLGFQPILKFHSFWAVFTLSADKKTESAVLQQSMRPGILQRIQLGIMELGKYDWALSAFSGGRKWDRIQKRSYFLHQTVLK